MKRFFHSTISSLLILSILIGSGFAAAPNISFAATENTVTLQDGTVVNAQSAAYTGGINNENGSGSSNQLANAAGGAVGCVAGQILGQLLTSSISSALTNTVTSQVTTSVNLYVPVAEKAKLLENSDTANAARTGTTVMGVMVSPSWDSIAWCVINTIIEYLIDATIEWAKNGFNGNPAFVDNPEDFFKGLVDQSAAGFINEIIGGATGINVCQPFKVQIGIGLANAYGVNGGKKLSCSLSSISNNLESSFGLADGSFDYNQFFTVSQFDQNNARGAYILGNEELGVRATVKSNTAKLELGWNQGFLNFKHCEGEGTGKKCITDTPGTLVQSSLEKSLGLPKDRLVLAQKFDQLVTVLINSLIKVALDEVLAGDEEEE